MLEIPNRNLFLSPEQVADLWKHDPPTIEMLECNFLHSQTANGSTAFYRVHAEAHQWVADVLKTIEGKKHVQA